LLAFVAIVLLMTPLLSQASAPPERVSIVQGCAVAEDWENYVACGPQNAVTQGDLLIVEISSAGGLSLRDIQLNSFQHVATVPIPSTIYNFSLYYAWVKTSGSDLVELTQTANKQSEKHLMMIVEVVSGATSVGQVFTAAGSSQSASVSNYTPPVGSFVFAATESSSSQETFSAGSGYAVQTTLFGSQGSMTDEALFPANGSSTTSPFALNTASGWAEVALWLSASSPPLLQLNLAPSGVSQTACGGVPGVTITYTSSMTAPLTSNIFISLVNSAGQVVYGPTFIQTSFSQGQNETFCFGLTGVTSGNYTAFVFATSSQYVVVSTTSTTEVTF
jgi:hypothetical protein